MTIDLSSVTSDADSAVNAVRFEFSNLSGSERVGLDNVHISGIAVDSGGDGVSDNYDAFPDDPTETADTDADGVGDNADADDTDGDSGINAQGLIAGWDFAGVTALDAAVNGYVADRTGVNNGVATSGSISTTLAQGSQVFFAANGNAATDPGFGDGFDQTTTDLFGGSETGQQSLNFTAGSSFDIAVSYTHLTLPTIYSV